MSSGKNIGNITEDINNTVINGTPRQNSIIPIEKFNKNECNLIDIRDVRELEREGRIEDSNHIPRGMLEFWLDPESAYFKQGKLDLNKEMVLFCAGGMRSALAAKSLKDMGFKKVSHIDGGFGALKQSKFKIT